MIGCFDRRIVAVICYAGMTAERRLHDIGSDRDSLFPTARLRGCCNQM
jgi:hypothetical protein